MPQHPIDLDRRRPCRAAIRNRPAWRRTTAGTILAALLCLLAGCAAQDHVKSADLAMSTGHYAEAVRNYEAALALKPSWAERDTFMARLSEARAKNAYSEGQALLEAGRWELAVDRFNAVLTSEPDHQPAQQSLAAAQQGAADARHRAAVDAAARGDRPAAEQAVREALAHMPSHAAAQLARQSLEQPETYPNSAALADHEQGAALAQRKQWDAALTHFEAAVAADGNFLPARLAASATRQHLSQARQHYAAGAEHAQANRLDDAIAALEHAVAIWPTHPQAAALLARVQDQRAQAQRLVEQADAALSQQQWDAAIADAERALLLFPDHPRAKQMAIAARGDAAAIWTSRGDQQLLAGDSAAARAAFAQVLRYAPEHDAARTGLATAARHDAAAAERAGRLGRALLYHLEANRHAPAAESVNSIASLQRRLGERAAVGISFDIDHADARVAADSASLLSQLQPTMSGRAPHFIMLDPAGDAALHVAAELHVLTLDIDEQRVRTEELTHQYTEHRQVPNPEIPRLEREVLLRQQWLLQMQLRHDRYDRDYQQARRHRPRHHDDDGEARRRHDRRVRDHWSARNRSDRDRSSAASALRQAERRLRNAPLTVSKPVATTWPYTRETHRKEGLVVVRVELDMGQLGAGTAFTVEETFARSDTRILNPNPPIGLRADELSLPGDQAVRSALIEAAAIKVRDQLVRQVIAARVAALQQAAREHEAAGDAAGALESRVTALVLERAVRGGHADRDLRQLSVEHSPSLPSTAEDVGL